MVLMWLRKGLLILKGFGKWIIKGFPLFMWFLGRFLNFFGFRIDGPAYGSLGAALMSSSPTAYGGEVAAGSLDYATRAPAMGGGRLTEALAMGVGRLIEAPTMGGGRLIEAPAMDRGMMIGARMSSIATANGGGVAAGSLDCATQAPAMGGGRLIEALAMDRGIPIVAAAMDRRMMIGALVVLAVGAVFGAMACQAWL